MSIAIEERDNGGSFQKPGGICRGISCLSRRNARAIHAIAKTTNPRMHFLHAGRNIFSPL
jgi:hypothetical protein